MASFINSTTLAVMFAGMFGFNPLARSTSTFFTILVNLYGFFLQILEPFLIVNEAVYFTQTILKIGEYFRTQIQDSEDRDYSNENSFSKKNLLKFFVLSTLLSSILISLYQFFHTGSFVFFILSAACMFLNLILHLYCFYNRRA